MAEESTENPAALESQITAAAGVPAIEIGETAPAPEAPMDPERQKMEERYELVRAITGKETFIDPINGEEIARAYAVYDRTPQKIIQVIVAAFQSYCRKCIREAALIKIKDEINFMVTEEAELLKTKTINELYDKVRHDPILEHLLVMLIFKNRFWVWLQFGLKEIFREQRQQPGNKLNSHFNYRFQRLKREKRFQKVGDLVVYDIAIIVNTFKSEVLAKRVRIF